MSLVAVLVSLCTLFAAVALATARVVSILARIGACDWLSGRSSLTLRAVVATAPLFVATFVCVAVVSVSLGGCHCYHHALHHPHLCFAHPEFALPLLRFALVGLALWTLSVAPATFRIARAVVRSHRWASRARRVASHFVDGVPVRLIDCSSRSAFTIGAVSPVIVCDTKLWNALDEEQRRAVVHHEAAHTTRHDGMTLLLLRLCVALFPSTMGGRLIAEWSRAAERECDRHAAATLGDGAVVADALVAVERVRSRATAVEEGRFVTAMAVLSPGAIEHRVLALLSEPPSDDRSRLANDSLALALLGLALAVATWILPGDSIHHGVETLAGLLSHLS